MGLFFSKPPSPKVVLITGTSSGIGKDCALALLKRGHVVYGAGLEVEKMKDIVEAGGHVMDMDITKDDQIVAAVSRVIKEQGKIDVLINNAGIGVVGAVENVSMEEARFQFDVNVFGMARITKEVLPHMRKQKRGTIINLSSMLGKVYTPYQAWYIASKHAIEGFSDCLRLEVKPFNIKVAIIEPGGTRTDFFENMETILRKRCEESPYEHDSMLWFARSVKGLIGATSQPSVISADIVRASESLHPKRRYVTGAFAWSSIWMRGWFGDAFFDNFTLFSFKSPYFAMMTSTSTRN